MTTSGCNMLGLVFAVLLLAGCAADSLTGPAFRLAETPEAPEAFLSIQDGQGRVFVLNTQLRPLPGDDPSQAHGHFQLKLRQVSGGTPDDGYEVAWKGKLFNPAGETFTGGEVGGAAPDDGLPDDGGEVGGQPPDDGLPDDGGEVGGGTPDDSRPVLVLMEGARETSRKINLRGEGVLPAGLAEALIARPEDFQAVFMTEALPEGAVAGNFGGGTPDDN